MSPTAKSFQIVLTIGICVPEVQESPANWLAPTIENKTRHPTRITRQARFAEVSLQRGVRAEKRPRRFLRRQFKLLTQSGSGVKLDRVAISAEQRLNSRKKGNRGRRNRDRMKKPAP